MIFFIHSPSTPALSQKQLGNLFADVLLLPFDEKKTFQGAMGLWCFTHIVLSTGCFYCDEAYLFLSIPFSWGHSTCQRAFARVQYRLFIAWYTKVLMKVIDNITKRKMSSSHSCFTLRLGLKGLFFFFISFSCVWDLSGGSPPSLLAARKKVSDSFSNPIFIIPINAHSQQAKHPVC